MSSSPQTNQPNVIKTPYIRVALRLALDRAFEYRCLDNIEIAVGSVVTVKVRGKPMRGVVIETNVKPSIAVALIKEIEAVMPELVAADQRALCSFVHRYYRAPIGMAYALALPPEPVKARKTAESAPQVLDTSIPAAQILLNFEQKIAADAIIDGLGRHQVFALHGITGSGKTEVYVTAIREVIARGGQALVLVPEINLTPQWALRLAAQLPAAQMVSLHSGLADGERFRSWTQASRGEAQIIFGTRMAIFAPLPKLSLIVVDEEHDASFKQQETPRYHARDLAVMRARARTVPVVLGSATPSLETFSNIQKSRYRLLTLSQRARADAKPPRVYLVPARDAKRSEGIAGALLTALDDRMGKGEQALVFLNRRGFSPLLHCGLCGWQSHCVDCDARMVFHSFDQKLRCHHCGILSKVPSECPSCGNLDIVPTGGGTQRVEAFLRRRYPHKKVARADADSTRGKHDWNAIYTEMASGEIDILVGTQMIAKGHDFPRLTLVGVLGADDSLYSADFRAPERLFAQLMQVAGRAGRAALAGEVLIQTEIPDHPVYAAVRAHDFAAFAQRELAERNEAGLPPAAHLALIRAESPDSNAAHHALKLMHRAMEAFARVDKITLYPPVPSALARRATKFRWQMLITAAERTHLHAALEVGFNREISAEVSVGVDVDAFDFG